MHDNYYTHCRVFTTYYYCTYVCANLLVSKSSKKKLPVGGVSMFGAPPGLSSPEEEKSVTCDDVSTVKSEVGYIYL